MTRHTLSEREKRFADGWIEHGNANRAHKEAGFMPNGSDGTHRKRAHMMLRRPHVAAYIAEAQARNAEANKVTIADLIKKLDNAYKLSIAMKKPQSMVSAVMGIARITGLDKQIVEHHMARPIELVINRPGSGA